MKEEEYFRKNYPDSCYGDKPLSPHWDFFQDGVEFGERQSEKRIAKLEAQIEKMKRCEICRHHSNLSGCSYHSGCVKDCKANGMKLFELKEIKEND